jgi:hypothetical protein
MTTTIVCVCRALNCFFAVLCFACCWSSEYALPVTLHNTLWSNVEYLGGKIYFRGFRGSEKNNRLKWGNLYGSHLLLQEAMKIEPHENCPLCGIVTTKYAQHLPIVWCSLTIKLWWPYKKSEKWYQPQVVLVLCTQSLYHFSLFLQGYCNLLYKEAWKVVPATSCSSAMPQVSPLKVLRYMQAGSLPSPLKVLAASISATYTHTARCYSPFQHTAFHNSSSSTSKEKWLVVVLVY